MNNTVKRLVIVGGGTAGWMSASLLSKVLGKQLEIELIESKTIGTIGVGEATIPPIQTFNSVLGIDENEFIRETKATFKLAIKFENWHSKGHNYFHTFGASGQNLTFCSFHHIWKRAQLENINENYWDFDLNYLNCLDGKFSNKKATHPQLDAPYAYHFDSTLYAQFLRKYSEKQGVIRTEGLIENVHRCTKTGNVKSLSLKSGKTVEADFFIDCSGARGLLIQKSLNAGYEDWGHWLPCDRAIAMPSENFETTAPYTRSIAHSAGWQWQIPLQHRNGNGIVFSSSHYSDEEAADILNKNLDSNPIGDPQTIRFRTGRARKQWHKNVVAIGLSSGFLEPLESTSIYLIQSAIVRLLHLFPKTRETTKLEEEYNRQSKIEYETVRDFIILHYVANQRNDSDFWRDLQEIQIPDRLAQKIELFKENGEFTADQYDIFLEPSWIQVMMGQGIIPQNYHPLADSIPLNDIMRMMAHLKTQKTDAANATKSHDDTLKSILSN